MPAKPPRQPPRMRGFQIENKNLVTSMVARDALELPLMNPNGAKSNSASEFCFGSVDDTLLLLGDRRTI